MKKVSSSLEYKHKQSSREVEDLVNEFPDNLKNKLLLVIYDKLISDNAFFKKKSPAFKASVVQFLSPFRIDEN